MEIKDYLLSIDGMNERFATLIVRYVENYINMCTNKSVVANNLIRQIKKNVRKISFESLDGISGSAGKTNRAIILDDNLDDWILDNTFLHEFTHQISKNEYDNGINLVQPNCGLKVGIDEQMEFYAGFRMTSWEVDRNNYAYNKGIETFDEWVTEWLANKMSGFINAEVKEDINGFFRKKTSHGYDGSNIMNLLELVYGSENVANLITGFDLSEEERKGVIPVIEIHKLNELIDSKAVLSKEETDIFKNLNPPYMKTPNITGLIVYYISEYQKQEELEECNIILQKIMNVLTRAYSIRFSEKIAHCSSLEDLRNLYGELSVIQNSMIWNENQEILKTLETYNLFDRMRSELSTKANNLNLSNEEFASLYLTPSQLLEKFKLEEEQVKKTYESNKSTTQKM